MKLFDNIGKVIYSPTIFLCAVFFGAIPTNAATFVPTNTSPIKRYQIRVPNHTSGQNIGLGKSVSKRLLAQTTTPPIRIEAESMALTTYRVESNSSASGGQVISFVGGRSNETGTAKTNFTSATGTYNVVVGYYDQNNGVGSLTVNIAGKQVDNWQLNQNLGTSQANSKSFVRRTIATELQINSGDEIQIQGVENLSERTRVDYIELTPIPKTTPTPTPTPTPAPTLTPTPAPSSSIPWKDRILNANGTINWTEYTNVAQNYHKREMIDYRFGPKYSDFHPTEESFPLVYSPSSDGIIRKNAGAWCRVDPGPDGDPGMGWMMSGQMLFSPDTNASSEYQFGSSNMRSSDGAMSFTDDGVCLRIRPEWEGDWWNRNNISTPTTPSVEQFYGESGGTLPLPPIATSRSVGSSITGFLAFQNGLIGTAGTGNDPYVGVGNSAYVSTKLDPGKVPTAMTVTNNNEFVLVTVWDTVNRKGQVAVLAVKNRQMAQEEKFYWGLPGWPTVEGLKLIGYIDLPFAAPNAIDVTVSTKLGNPRGHADNVDDDFSQQSVRDNWYNTAWDTWYGDNYWKQTAQSGYAIVSSRAENKVAFIDLRPLLKYYRKMYLTTQTNFDQTKNEGTASNQWPHTFSYAPEQIPVLSKVLTVSQPTSVATGNRWNSFRGPRSEYNHEVQKPLKTAYIASMDGTVRLYDVESLILPNTVASIPETPFKSFQVGRNPVQMFHGYHSTSGDDYYIVSRGDRAIYYTYYDGTVNAILRDSRLKDPVNVAVSYDSAGYMQSGNGLYSHVLTVMDFGGKQIVNYMVDDGVNSFGEQLKLLGPNGENMIFQHGYSNPVNGNPFMFTLDEVI